MRRRGLAAAAAGLLAGCSPAGLLNATVSASGVETRRDLVYQPGPRGRLDVYRPTDRFGGLPLVVFLYGGGWKAGDKGQYGFVGWPLARRGAVVVIPDYRLYPEVRFPAFLEDNARAVAWAVAHAVALGASAERVVLMGHSAGAFNAAMLALDPAWLGAAGVDRGRLAGTIGLAGPYHFLPTHDPAYAPIFGADNTPAHEPYAFADGRNRPMLLLAGADDETVRPRNTTDLAGKIRANGGPVAHRIYPGLGHIGLITAIAPVFQSRAPVLEDVGRFVTRVTAGS